MSMRTCAIPFSLLLLLAMPLAGAELPAVNESARDIPLAYEVDVVVVGGGTGAVSAAAAAARSGAKVFLAAPHPYLGDDMTATLRLWLEEGETPDSALAKRIFSDPARTKAAPDPNRIPITYNADRPSAAKHKDTSPPKRLTDGVWGDASKQSVQYDGQVNITADLKRPQPIREVRLVVYHRATGDREANFKVKAVSVFTSDDNQTWKKIATLPNPLLDPRKKRPPKEPPVGCTLTLSAPVEAEARYVRLLVEKTDDVDRVLLGEIEVIRAESPEAPAPAPKYPPPRPMHVKQVLDEALLAAGVEFLYSCYPTDVLRDADGYPAGIVMANRAGRQAVVAKTIIDATDRAHVARMAGVKFRPYGGGLHTFKRVVVGGEARSGENLSARIIEPAFGKYPIIEYTLRLTMADDSYASFAAADQRARSMTYHAGQQFTSDVLFEVPPDAVFGSDLPLGRYRPSTTHERIWILGGCADVPREQAAELLRPVALIELGKQIGEAAATQAKARPKPRGVHLPGLETKQPVAEGDVGEFLQGIRPTQQLPTIPQHARAVPVLGQYDVVVIGGGTAGAPAGIAAARQGAQTLVVEYLHGLGGVGTEGAISKYYWGNRVGFTASIPGGAGWIIERRKQWYRQELLKAGAEIWFGTIGCGAVVRDGSVVGAVVVTPQGRGVVLAKAVVDATGNSDVAAAAGAECIYTDASEFAMQGTGLPGLRLGGTYNNTDFTIVDETDMLDVWRMFVFSKGKYADAFDHGRLIDTRERRRIVGESTITLLDQVNARTYGDSVVWTRSNFDTHGYTVDPYCMIEHPGHAGFDIYIPYRCLLPKDLDGLIVAGLGISAHRDAVPMIRMQPDIQNGGYAAGVAAAMAAEAGTLTRNIDVGALQKHLVEIGNLPESVLSDKDSYPMPDEKIAAAVEAISAGGKGVAVIMAHPQKALPLLRKAYAAADESRKPAYARVLCTMGDSTGLETLMARLRAAPKWDRGWNYRGMGQFGNALSPLDVLIVAMGRTRDRRAVPVILEKLELLSAESEFSHHRAVGLALELIGDRSAAEPLARLLAKPGMTGYAQTTIGIAKELGAPGGTNAVAPRRESIRELALARALFRCGDHKGQGKKVLQTYTNDLRGHLARHALAVLQSAGSAKASQP